MADAEPVPSPCRDICRLDGEDVCIGCGRTIDEIARWLAMTDEEKRAVLSRLNGDDANPSTRLSGGG